MATATPSGSDVAGGYGDLPGLGPDGHVGLAVDEGGSSSYHSSGDDEDLEEEEALSMEDRVKLAEIWVANPTSSHHWTSGAGGDVVLHDAVWEFRIHFDSQPNLDMKLCLGTSDSLRSNDHCLLSDPTTSIHTLIDNCRVKYGVDVARHMAYRAKNLVVEVVLGEHKKQYPRLSDYAHTIMDTNPSSRVVVTTVTPKPTTKIPHLGPRFHAMFFCINGAREGFLNGCRPFIG
ncbi:hypothetical protein D1007_49304 [Hordeum vulgare]|nr:hypothetical protein D1007_49304 [Hordeum vulgare]